MLNDKWGEHDDAKGYSHLATSLTLIVAALTFVYTIWERNSREQRREIEDWQKVVIYDLIETGSTEFDEIRTRYVVAVQQFSGFHIPQKDIQDGALKRLILSMVEAHLISITDAGTYAVNRVSLSEDQFKRVAVLEIQKRQSFNIILSNVFQTLDSDSGKFTIDQLYRSARAQEMGLSFEDFAMLLKEQITRGSIASFQDGKLWARGRISQRPPNPTGGTGRVEDGRGSKAPFPIPAHQTGRADFPHPAFRLASLQGARR